MAYVVLEGTLHSLQDFQRALYSLAYLFKRAYIASYKPFEGPYAALCSSSKGPV